MGIKKILERVWYYYVWLGLWKFVNDFVGLCNICGRNKYWCYKFYGLLN